MDGNRMSEDTELVGQLLAEAEASNRIAQALLDAVTALAEATTKVNEAALGLADLDWRVAANVLALLRKITHDSLLPIDAALVRHLWANAPHGETEIDGLGVMAVRRTGRTKRWRAEEALWAVLDAHMDERGGEQPDPGEVLRWLIDAVGIQYVRTTYLRGLHLKPDDYRETKTGRPNVTFT